VISFGGANRRLGGFGSPRDYATFKFPPTPRHDQKEDEINTVENYRRTVSATVSRYIRQAENMIASAGLGSFP